jgi:hypothetical protein
MALDHVARRATVPEGLKGNLPEDTVGDDDHRRSAGEAGADGPNQCLVQPGCRRLELQVPVGELTEESFGECRQVTWGDRQPLNRDDRAAGILRRRRGQHEDQNGAIGQDVLERYASVGRQNRSSLTGGHRFRLASLHPEVRMRRV